MISVASIAEYSYCPVKVYLKHVLDKDVQTNAMKTGKFMQEIRRGFEELIKRNMWHVEADNNIDRIFNILFDDIPPFIRGMCQKYYDKEYSDMYRNLKLELELECHFMAVKIKKIVHATGKNGLDIVEMVYPQSLLEFPLESEELNLRGKIDKIEILNGIYYPIEIKTNIPPVKGVWDAHALQIAAYSILMEQEFNKEILVGFVDYIKIGERRPVVVNSKLHEKLFGVLDDINMMFDKNEVPEIKPNIKKCKKCEYNKFCDYYKKK